jgi:hypothetical protein
MRIKIGDQEITPDPDTMYEPRDLEPMGFGKLATLAYHRWNGTGLPYTKIGRKIFYKGSDLIAAIEAGRVEPSTSAERREPKAPKPERGAPKARAALPRVRGRSAMHANP